MNDIKRAAIAQHVARQWPNLESKIERWTKGPVAQVMPDLRVIVLSPAGPRGPWVYVTSGTSDVDVGATYGQRAIATPRHRDVANLLPAVIALLATETRLGAHLPQVW